MGTVVDKLNKLLGTKSAIRQAIVDMGQSVIGTASFAWWRSWCQQPRTPPPG